jgi:hypothetical protein
LATYGGSLAGVVPSDIIHWVYNLVYPAILGTFLYEVIGEGRWSICSPGVSPAEASRRGPGIIIRQLVVLIVYSVDFVLAKKFYDVYSKDFSSSQAWGAVVVELVTLTTLSIAFSKAADAAAYFRALFAFGLAVLAFFYLLRDVIHEQAISARSGSVALVTIASLALWLVPRLRESDVLSHIAAVLIGGCAVIYYCLTLSPGSPLAYRLSISGSTCPIWLAQGQESKVSSNSCLSGDKHSVPSRLLESRSSSAKDLAPDAD